jgi:hypothetical protein
MTAAGDAGKPKKNNYRYYHLSNIFKSLISTGVTYLKNNTK